MNLLPFGPFLFSVSLTLLGLPVPPELAQAAVPAGWPAQFWAQTMGGMAFLAVIGLLLAFVGYSLLDQCVPREPPPR